VEAFPKHQRYSSSMSIDVGYIADNRRFSVAPNAGSGSQPEGQI
jgi:hypothetical protein